MLSQVREEERGKNYVRFCDVLKELSLAFFSYSFFLPFSSFPSLPIPFPLPLPLVGGYVVSLHIQSSLNGFYKALNSSRVSQLKDLSESGPMKHSGSSNNGEWVWL